MDLDEYALSEAQRTLKRLGITHLWREAGTAEPSPPVEAAEPVKPATPKPVPTRPERATPSPAETALPPLLKTLFHGKQPPVSTLWTYAGLYSDMQQAGVPARLDMFRKIQASVRTHLGWAENDICAWPLDVPPAVFQQGLRFFRPKIVIVFGPQTGLPVAAAEDRASAQPEAAVVTLPDIDEMAAGNKQLKNEAWQILQNVRP